jgi:hypothetical protein
MWERPSWYMNGIGSVLKPGYKNIGTITDHNNRDRQSRSRSPACMCQACRIAGAGWFTPV